MLAHFCCIIVFLSRKHSHTFYLIFLKLITSMISISIDRTIERNNLLLEHLPAKLTVLEPSVEGTDTN